MQIIFFQWRYIYFPKKEAGFASINRSFQHFFSCLFFGFSFEQVFNAFAESLAH